MNPVSAPTSLRVVVHQEENDTEKNVYKAVGIALGATLLNIFDVQRTQQILTRQDVSLGEVWRKAFHGAQFKVANNLLSWPLYLVAAPYLKKAEQSIFPSHPILNSIFPYAILTVADVALTTPTSTIAVRMQNKDADGNLKSWRQVLKEIPKGQRIRSLYKGSIPSLIRHLPANTAFFPLYNSYKETLENTQAGKSRTVQQRVIINIFASILAYGSYAPFQYPFVYTAIRIKAEPTKTMRCIVREIFESRSIQMAYTGFRAEFSSKFFYYALFGVMTEAASLLYDKKK